MLCGEVQCIGCAISAELLGFAQDVSPQWMSGEQHLLEIVEDEFLRRVFVALYLIDDDLYFLVHLVLGEGAVEHDVREQFGSPFEVFAEKSGIDHHLLLVRVGIQVAAHMLHAVQYVPGSSVGSALEQHVFYKMRHSLPVERFVACAGFDGKSAVSHPGRRWRMDDAQAVR